MLIAGRIDNFKEFSQFETIEKFNNTIEMFLADHKADFTKGELIALKRLVRYSAKFYGVANAKIGTILKAINEKANGYGVSRSTFERMLNKAKGLGILGIKNTVKAKGGKGHNVYVFNKIDVLKKEKLTYCPNPANPSDCKADSHSQKRETIILLETNNIKNINKRIDVLDSSFTSDNVPKEFKDTVKHFFNDAKTIEEYWKMVRIDTYKDRVLDNKTVLTTAIHSFKQMISKLKAGKVSNPIAYFTGVIKKQLEDTRYNARIELLESGLNGESEDFNNAPRFEGNIPNWLEW